MFGDEGGLIFGPSILGHRKLLPDAFVPSKGQRGDRNDGGIRIQVLLLPCRREDGYSHGVEDREKGSNYGPVYLLSHTGIPNSIIHCPQEMSYY